MNTSISPATLNRREFGAGIAALLAGACFGAREALGANRPTMTMETVEQLAKSDHIALLEACRALCAERLKDYSGVMTSQESIDGRLFPERTAAFKCREQPFSVLLEYKSGAPEVAPTIFSRRLVYVEGENNGSMLVYVRSVVNGESLDLPRVFKINPDDPQVAKNSRKPITQFGILRGLDASLAVYRTAKERGELLEQSLHGKTQVDGRPCLVLKRVVPERVGADGRKAYIAAVTYTTIDLGYLLPVEALGYDNNGKLEFSFKVKIESFNKGLQREDFLPKK